MNARLDNQIPVNTKNKKITLTSIVNNSLPRALEIPNVKTITSINEVADDLKSHKLKGASSYRELEKLLNE